MHKLGIIAAVVTVLLLTGIAQMTRADAVDDYLKAQMAARHIPGLSVAIVQNGRTVKSQGYGQSDTIAKASATAETVYQIGSLTKQFTATAILTLIQQRKLSADDPIADYINGLPVAWKPITVRELLNQTSGIYNYRQDLDYPNGAAAKDYTAAQVIQLANAKPLDFSPGTHFEYSNTNYHLLGMVIEKVSGKSYSDFMQQTFFGPLGMTQTRMTRPSLAVPNAAQGTLWVGAAVHSSPFVLSPTINFGDDGILSTVTDLAKWNTALDGDQFLSSASKQLLWTPPALTGGTATKYAGGWFVAEAEGHKMLWHNGATLAGFTGAIFKFPADKLTLIVLTNSLDIPGLKTSLPLYSLGIGLAKLYLPDLAKPIAGISDTSPQTAALVKTVITQLATGTLDKSLIAPTYYAKVFTPDMLASAQAALAPLDPLSSLVLVSRASGGTCVYRAQYGARAVAWTVTLSKEGKIASIGFQETQ